MAFLPECLSQDRAGDYSISGAVINSVTSEPIRQALITVTGYGPTRSRSTGSLIPSGGSHEIDTTVESAMTDSSGTFRIRGLRGGTYSIEVQKPGYEPAPTKGDGNVTLGPSQDGVKLYLSPLGSISGRVLDGDGEPAPGIAIRALRSRILDGRRELTAIRSVRTDDLGRYHLWNMNSGTYYILAAGRSGGTVAYAGQSPSPTNAHEAFAPVYYANAADVTSATAIAMEPGKAFEADLRILMQPGVRLRGIVRNHDPRKPVILQAFPRGGTVSAIRASVNPRTGRFEIFDLVPGAYLIRASQGEGVAALRAQRELEIDGVDVEGLALDLAAGTDVKVTITGPPAGTQEQPQLQALLTRVELIEVEGDRVRRFASAHKDGATVIPAVPGGNYRLRVNALRGYAVSAIAGGQDLLRGALLAVAPGIAPPDIEIVLRNDGGDVSGTVAGDVAGTDGLWALLAPVAPGAEPRTTPAGDGEFEFRNVAPGDYRAYLLKSIDTVEYRNPDVLSTLRGGQGVHVTAHGSVDIVLKEVAQ